MGYVRKKLFLLDRLELETHLRNCEEILKQMKADKAL